MKNQYDKQYLLGTLAILSDQISDLSMWSVYNDDELIEEIERLQTAIGAIKIQQKLI